MATRTSTRALVERLPIPELGEPLRREILAAIERSVADNESLYQAASDRLLHASARLREAVSIDVWPDLPVVA